ncbi:MAG: ammonium transporter [Planctomycetota bacterium]
MNSGDTAWVLMSAALVLSMTVPALAFFYGGLVRRKNVLSVLVQCFAVTCLVSLQWMTFGYSLAFGPDLGGVGVIGTLDWAMLEGVGGAPNASYAPTIPHAAFMAFQMMFAVITPALILGAFAERMRFAPFCAFALLWSTLVYDPVCHWVWSSGADGQMGWLKRLGALDFAGGIVVHVNAGAAALAAAIMLGRRVGYPDRMSPPHNLPFAVLGAGLLWFGWFGFNAGSALGANALAANAFVATHAAAAIAGLAWAAIDAFWIGRPTALGTITGCVAGLAAVTPACGYVGLQGALAIGLGATLAAYPAVVILKARLGYDDALDAFGVHGVAGVWGVLATGLFATQAANPEGPNGLFRGGGALVGAQAIATAATFAFSFAATFVLLKAVDATLGLRAAESEERIGLDLTEHRETGYTLLDG